MLVAYEQQVLRLQLHLDCFGSPVSNDKLAGDSSKHFNSRLSEKWRDHLRTAFRQKLNPKLHGGIKGGTRARAQYISTFFVDDKKSFASLFPKAVSVKQPPKEVDLVKKSKKLPGIMLCGYKKKAYPKAKFVETTLLYSWKVNSLKDLDDWFGDDSWRLVHNNKSVGFACLPIEFRLVQTTITSHKTKMANGWASEKIVYFDRSVLTHLNISLHRGSVSRGAGDREVDWPSKIATMQDISIEVDKRNEAFHAKNSVIIEDQ